ncbi:MAG: type II toxin-antitoxin system RelE/ParE family toxin [Methanospirillum sp.]|nr:type II toxin-antitoxin system RelE/ParE family toxin [Methanospirillum sp.]
MHYILIEKKAREYLQKLPIKTRRIIVGKIQELSVNPYPGSNKEKLECYNSPVVYRLHISRSYTVFYLIDEEKEVVKIEKIETIEKAHKTYSRR